MGGDSIIVAYYIKNCGCSCAESICNPCLTEQTLTIVGGVTGVGAGFGGGPNNEDGSSCSYTRDTAYEFYYNLSFDLSYSWTFPGDGLAPYGDIENKFGQTFYGLGAVSYDGNYGPQNCSCLGSVIYQDTNILCAGGQTIMQGTALIDSLEDYEENFCEFQNSNGDIADRTLSYFCTEIRSADPAVTLESGVYLPCIPSFALYYNGNSISTAPLNTTSPFVVGTVYVDDEPAAKLIGGAFDMAQIGISSFSVSGDLVANLSRSVIPCPPPLPPEE